MPKKLERCIRKVKAKGKVKNPWAVCISATGIKKKKGGGWTKGKKSKKKRKR
jgi:hypothetical protein